MLLLDVFYIRFRKETLHVIDFSSPPAVIHLFYNVNDFSWSDGQLITLFPNEFIQSSTLAQNWGKKTFY